MSTIKLPKSFNKMSLSEQESFLVKKFQESVMITDNISKLLAKVRGGQKVNLQLEPDRPDEMLLKNAK
jgi:hypothetical protein